MDDASLIPTPLAAALMYSGQGWRVAPVAPESKVPSIREWPTAATTDPSTIHAWYGSWEHGGDGVCIVTGRDTGLWVLDVDVAAGKPGVASLRALMADHGCDKLPATLVSVTPSGGYHYFFAYPTDREIHNSASSRLGAGLDVRGEGGQVNAAPTKRGEACYRWAHGRAPWEADQVLPAPSWLVDLVADKAPEPSPAIVGQVTSGDAPAWVDEFNRSTTWGDLLVPDGWTHAFTDSNDVGHWVRPGKDRREGTSATTNYAGLDCLYVYTTSIPWLPAESMVDKYGYMVRRDHDGDFRAAADRFKPAPTERINPADLVAADDPNKDPVMTASPGEDVLRSLEIDFSPDGPFWNSDVSDEQWLIPDFVAPGRGHALYASAKVGKSFIALQAIAAASIPGHSSWAGRREAGDLITVVYLDYEMTEADLRERLEGFGYGPNDDYSRFHYVRAMAFGSDLDTHEGGAGLLDYALAVNADLVVVDTMSRAVRGDENDADTVRHFYQATGGRLKGHNIALLRLDHAGKTAEKGQRGSSGKNDDVDVVWRLERNDAGVEMTCTHKRMGWVPDRVSLSYHEDDDDGVVVLKRADGDVQFPAGCKAMAEKMDAAGVPLDATVRQAKAMGVKGSQKLFGPALRYRRQEAERLDFLGTEKASYQESTAVSGNRIKS